MSSRLIGRREDSRAEKLFSPDDLHAEQAPVRVEVENDVAAARALYDDVLDDRSIEDVPLDGEIRRIRFPVAGPATTPARP